MVLPDSGRVGAPDFGGYWLIDSDGAEYGFGDARYSSFPSRGVAEPFVAVADDYTVSADGTVLTLGGGAGMFGSMAGRHLNAPIVGIVNTWSYNGYWLVASDGGIFSFGGAPFLGSLAGRHLKQPIVAMTNSRVRGYWELAADGGVFSFGKATYFGSGASRPAPHGDRVPRPRSKHDAAMGLSTDARQGDMRVDYLGSA